MDKLIKLMCGFLAGTFVGFLASIEMFGGTITATVLHDAAMLVLVMAGLCGLAIFVFRRLELV